MQKIATALLLTTVMGATAAQAATSTYAQTKYPVVLAHGMMGWDTMVGIEYWYQIPNDLRSNGASVYVTQASGLESSEVRGEQLLKQVKEILAITGQPKVNLIGHSHGGHSVRYVAALMPERIATVTTMATPAKGAPMADLIVNGGTGGAVGSKVIQAAGTILNVLNGGSRKGLPVSATNSLKSLSTAGSAAFNAKFPQAIPTTACGEGAYVVNQVQYYSFAGVAQSTSLLDLLDPAVKLVALAFTNGEQNDGFVGRCSAHVGRVVRDNYNMNHIDFMNHMLGARASDTDPKVVYRTQLNRLKLAGN